jgi:hypothetical protein
MILQFTEMEQRVLVQLWNRHYTSEQILRKFPGFTWDEIKLEFNNLGITPPPAPVQESAKTDTEKPIPSCDGFSVLVDQAAKQSEALGDTLQSILGVLAHSPTEHALVEFSQRIYTLWCNLEEPRMPVSQFLAHMMYRNFIIIPRPILKPILTNDKHRPSHSDSSNPTASSATGESAC